jgi:hypothetical protein
VCHQSHVDQYTQPFKHFASAHPSRFNDCMLHTSTGKLGRSLTQTDLLLFTGSTSDAGSATTTNGSTSTLSPVSRQLFVDSPAQSGTASAAAAAVAAAAVRHGSRKRSSLSDYGRVVMATSAVTAVMCSLAATYMTNQPAATVTVSHPASPTRAWPKSARAASRTAASLCGLPPPDFLLGVFSHRINLSNLSKRNNQKR